MKDILSQIYRLPEIVESVGEAGPNPAPLAKVSSVGGDCFLAGRFLLFDQF